MEEHTVGRDLEYRHQADFNTAEARDLNSLSTAIDTGQESLTRQEYGPDTDINQLIKRYGPNGFTTQRPFEIQEVDFGMDLATAIRTAEEMKDLYRRLPEALKREYPTWQGILAAIDRGEIRIKPEQDPPADIAVGTPPTPTPPAG